MTWSEIQFNPGDGYPVAQDIFIECLDCGDRIPTIPPDSTGCSCRNVFIDIDAGRVSVKRDARVRLLRKSM